VAIFDADTFCLRGIVHYFENLDRSSSTLHRSNEPFKGWARPILNRAQICVLETS
jgi:hypothetical protein